MKKKAEGHATLMRRKKEGEIIRHIEKQKYSFWRKIRKAGHTPGVFNMSWFSYLPARSIASKIGKSRGEPVVDLVQGQLLFGGLVNSLVQEIR